MRINGFEQIKAFYSWVFNNPDKVRPTHISLYLFLWNQGNRANWVEWFKCPYDLAMQGACIGSKSTYYKCLDDLQSYELIKYKKGLNNYKAPQIHLIKLYKTVPLTEQVTVPLSAPLPVLVTEPLSVLLTGNIYKLITDNYKLVNKEALDWIDGLKNKEEPKISTEFSEKDFLNNWAICRSHKDLPTNMPKLTFQERNEFERLKKEYTRKQINDAMVTLFELERIPVDSMILRPKHFLENFETYFSGTGCKTIYGKKQNA